MYMYIMFAFNIIKCISSKILHKRELWKLYLTRKKSSYYMSNQTEREIKRNKNYSINPFQIKLLNITSLNSCTQFSIGFFSFILTLIWAVRVSCFWRYFINSVSRPLTSAYDSWHVKGQYDILMTEEVNASVVIWCRLNNIF